MRPTHQNSYAHISSLVASSHRTAAELADSAAAAAEFGSFGSSTETAAGFAGVGNSTWGSHSELAAAVAEDGFLTGNLIQRRA